MALMIETVDLKKHFVDGDRTIDVLRGVDFALSAGESVAVTGKSGSGKSTFLHVLSGLDRVSSGALHWHGQAVESLGLNGLAQRRKGFIGFIFQAFYLIPELTVLENVLMPYRLAGAVTRAERERGEELLTKVGLQERLHYQTTRLSGGERQRVAAVRALINKPEVLFADEPTGNLDEETADEMVDLLFELTEQEGVAMVLVTHSRGIAARADRWLHMSQGQLVTQ